MTGQSFVRLRAWFLCIVPSLIVAMMCAAVAPVAPVLAVGQVDNARTVAGFRTSGKLTPRLLQLAQLANRVQRLSAVDEAQLLSVMPEGAGSLMRDDAGRLLVYVTMADVSAANQQALALTGAEIVHVAPEFNVVTILVAPSQLNALSAIAAVTSVREELQPLVSHSQDRPQTGAGAYAPAACPGGANVSEGDSQLRASLARSNFGVDGSGIAVGVLSDSYSQYGSAVTTAAQDVTSGDLPGTTNPCGRLTAVSVISSSLSSSSKDEGRAMLQIIHDLAPGATLKYASAVNGLYQFAANIRNLKAAGANIIVDDVSYSSEPFFQDGPVSVAISDVVAAGAWYFTSAGNSNASISSNNVSSYEAPAYRPVSRPTGIPSDEGTCHDFDPSGGTSSSESLTLDNNGYINVTLQWAQPWFGVTTDLDFFLLNSSNVVVAGSTLNSMSVQIPFESFSWQNLTGSAQTYRLVVCRYTGGTGNSGTPRFKYIMIRSSGLSSIQFPTSSGGDIVGPTVFGHSATDYGLSVAAVPYDDSANPETFTSRGPGTHYFGPVIGSTAAATLPSAVTVNKPDFAATDGGCNTFFLPPVSDGCYRFYGTSAAAPHAAAVGALMMHRANQIGAALRQSDAETILQNTARTVSGGSTTSVGAGLIDATAALSQVVASPFHAYLPTVAFSATAASTPQPGYWPSTTFEEFYVDTTGTLVKNFAVYVNVGGCGDYKITHTKAETITNNAFAFTGTFYASGAFDSTTTAHGTNGLSSFPIAGCGNVTGGPWLWTAEWHDSSQPAVVNAMLTRPDGIVTPITVTLSTDSTSLRKQSPPVLCYWSNTVESETQGVCEVNNHFA